MPDFGTDFATRGELYGYLLDYARESGVLELIQNGLGAGSGLPNWTQTHQGASVSYRR
ncbi:hypothetical protein ACFXDH_01385 [Streptomyces sp. NPDC059467]|uniref:hypothetical protein n=1 Tax=Streptomyces sp. NPDC059467 TaxID=3346844 RepID=UPI00368CE1C1